MFRVILSELIEITKLLAQVLLLASGLLVCVALGVLISFSLLGQAQQGVDYFFSIMVVESLPTQIDIQGCLALINWFTLFLVVIYIPTIHINNYLQDLKLKARLSN